MDVLRDASADTLELRGRMLAITRLAVGVWTAGWLACAAAFLSQPTRYGWNVADVAFITIWASLGFIALVAIAWAAAGQRERIRVNGQELCLSRRLGPFGRTFRFNAGEIRALRVLPPTSLQLATYRAIRAFWDRGAGRLGFDVAGRTYAFAPCIDDESAGRVLARIAAHLPAAVVQPLHAESQMQHSRQLPLGWITYVTGWVIVAAVVAPLRMAIVDLPICTGGTFGGTYYPIDVSRRDRTGRIVLAPFGDFPLPVARQVGGHFASKYGLDVVVASPLGLPPEAWDVSRRQVDSDVLLRTLERTYPPTALRTIVIGLTNHDMFNGGMNWRYAFSNRLPPRFAVVSPVRMDRGCMGLPAADATVLVRLRKMVGKNIGVLFFRLPLSDHPRSMMYGSIGGPQELDTMLEEF